jgi:hypothetical protein
VVDSAPDLAPFTQFFTLVLRDMLSCDTMIPGKTYLFTIDAIA